MKGPLLEELGDAAFIVRFPGEFSLERHDQLMDLVKRLDRARPPGVRDVVPGHTQVLIAIDPATPDARAIAAYVRRICRDVATPMPKPAFASPPLAIPVCFDEPHAPDLENLARVTRLDRDDVIRCFCAATYQCTVVGFRPGFPYLIGLPQSLHADRHGTPRLAVPAGSVAVAGAQTGIYPNDGPGGWQLVGRTPLRLFEPSTATALIAPGQKVTFEPIDAAAFAKLASR